jgi:hypothetical protein
VTLGRANPPDAIKHQRIATAEQEQRVNTERQRKLAEDMRRGSEESRAVADNAYREAMRLSPEQFLQLEQIKMLHDVCGGGKCSFEVLVPARRWRGADDQRQVVMRAIGRIVYWLTSSARFRCLFGAHFFAPYGNLGRERQVCMRCGTVKGAAKAPSAVGSSERGACSHCGR